MIQEVKLAEKCQIEEIEKSFPQVFVENSVNRHFENPFTKVFVLTENEEIIGLIILDIIYERMELVQIIVKEEHQQKGYGTKMMEHMLNIAKSKNLENITLEVKEDNIKAISLYQKFGFQKCAMRANYYQGTDGILMERKMM